MKRTARTTRTAYTTFCSDHLLTDPMEAAYSIAQTDVSLGAGLSKDNVTVVAELTGAFTVTRHLTPDSPTRPRYIRARYQPAEHLAPEHITPAEAESLAAIKVFAGLVDRIITAPRGKNGLAIRAGSQVIDPDTAASLLNRDWIATTYHPRMPLRVTVAGHIALAAYVCTATGADTVQRLAAYADAVKSFAP